MVKHELNHCCSILRATLDIEINISIFLITYSNKFQSKFPDSGDLFDSGIFILLELTMKFNNFFFLLHVVSSLIGECLFSKRCLVRLFLHINELPPTALPSPRTTDFQILLVIIFLSSNIFYASEINL